MLFTGLKPELEADREAAPEYAGPEPFLLARAWVRTAFSLSWICLGLASVCAVAATASSLPLHPGRSAVVPKAALSEISAARAHTSGFVERWHEEWTQIVGRIGAVARRPHDDSWLWTNAMLSPYATRFIAPEIGGAAPVVATPLPLPRPDGIPQRAVVASPPAAGEPRVASLPPEPQPQPSEPGILDKLFGDPERAAKAVLAAHPNTVLYDITKRAVYLPDGTKLEAHSGFG